MYASINMLEITQVSLVIVYFVCSGQTVFICMNNNTRLHNLISAFCLFLRIPSGFATLTRKPVENDLLEHGEQLEKGNGQSSNITDRHFVASVTCNEGYMLQHSHDDEIYCEEGCSWNPVPSSIETLDEEDDKGGGFDHSQNNNETTTIHNGRGRVAPKCIEKMCENPELKIINAHLLKSVSL